MFMSWRITTDVVPADTDAQAASDDIGGAILCFV